MCVCKSGMCVFNGASNEYMKLIRARSHHSTRRYRQDPGST